MKYKILANIYVSGNEIQSTEDAINALDIMLGCYDDMDDTDTDITISVKTSERA